MSYTAGYKEGGHLRMKQWVLVLSDSMQFVLAIDDDDDDDATNWLFHVSLLPLEQTAIPSCSGCNGNVFDLQQKSFVYRFIIPYSVRMLILVWASPV